MVEEQKQMNNGAGVNTEMHMASELIGRFRSKSDFMKYFKEQL